MSSIDRAPDRGGRAARILALLAVVLPAAAAPPAPPDPREPPAAYRLGIFPYLTPRSIVEQWGPVSAVMSAALGVPVRLESATSFSGFATGIATRTYDIALIQPFDYAEAVDKRGYIPLARLSAPLVTQFFVRSDSRYRRLADLRGTVVALPPAPSANARMALRALRDHHLVPGRDLEVRYFNANDSCIQQVWIGGASACATAQPPIASFEQRMRASLRPVYDTPAIPHVLFVVHPRVPVAQRERLRKLVIGWSDDDAGRALLKRLNFPGFVRVKPGEYDVIRRYGAAVGSAQGVRATGEPLQLGMYPFVLPRMLADQFAPLAAALAAVAGQGVQLRTAGSYGSYVDNISAGRFDILIVQPFDFVTAVRQGYLPLAQMSGKFVSRVYVRADSPYQRLADLKGERLAMPPRESATSRLGHIQLTANGMVADRDIAIDYRSSHDSCLQQVRRGQAAACATSTHAFTSVPAELSGGLRPIADLGAVPGVVILVHPRVPETVRERLRDELLSWGNTESGRRLIRDIQLGPFVPVNPAEFENLPLAEE